MIYLSPNLPIMLMTVVLVTLYIYMLKEFVYYPLTRTNCSKSTYEFIAGMTAIYRTRRYEVFSFIYTFLFILIGNLLGMSPYSFTWTSHIMLLLRFLFIFIGVTIIAIYKHGLLKFMAFLHPQEFLNQCLYFWFLLKSSLIFQDL